MRSRVRVLVAARAESPTAARAGLHSSALAHCKPRGADSTWLASSGAEKGFITCKEMASVCKVLGEDLDEDEVTDMVSEAISNFKGEIYYDGFVKILLAN